MKTRINNHNDISNTTIYSSERGSAIVISLFVLALITVFVVFALTRSSAEAAATGNETAEGRTFYAAQGSLEMMTRNFNKKFEVSLRPTVADFNDVRNAPVPGLSISAGGDYMFTQEVDQTTNNQPVVLTGGPFSGLYAKRDNWRLRTTATNRSGTQVQLTRNILNNLVPIFQFGIFYDDSLEFHPGPRFDFGGRVHSNGSLFLQAGTGVYFSSKVSTANFIYTDTSKNGSIWSTWDDNVFIKNASGAYVQLQYNMGSVQSAVNGAPVTANPPPSVPNPVAYNRASWPTNRALFDGNLIANSKPLQLPLKLNSDNTSQNLGLIEVIKRGKKVGDMWNDGTGTVASPNIIPVTAAKSDDAITAAERYYNKTGIRVSLADSKAKLPGCATATAGTRCGIRLDGDAGGQTIGAVAGARGYQPKPMVDGYQATEINGERFWLNIPNREAWIKVETVIYNAVTEVYDTVDITEEILSLGVTEEAPRITTGNTFSITTPGYGTGVRNDSRSVIKLQRFMFGGTAVPTTANIMQSATFGGVIQNYVVSATRPAAPAGSTCASGGTTPANNGTFPNGIAGDNPAHWKTATSSLFPGILGCVVPFPINMFDTREGLYNDTAAVFAPLTTYGTNVPLAGVMSMVDIDVANLKKFLDGNFDANMPAIPGTPFYVANNRALQSTDIPQQDNGVPKKGGWVFYVSDRRGDFDFDGEYDMEDVYGNNDGILQVGEDLNGNGTLQGDYTNEAPTYTGAGSNVAPDIAAVLEHKHYRRGVRLINAQTIPGFYDTATPVNTRGFTVASENAVYVKGNYNATGIAAVGTPTASTDYLPLSTTSADVPASIAADAITILSNSWQDALSFSAPFNLGSRVASETHTRFAMLSGDTITSLSGTPNQGGGDLRMNGGVHNFKRFLENWGGTRLNYSGSLINLFNSHNNNAPFKCCNNVYSPPTRNWVFDASFLDVNRLPPGTPYFQYAQTTGFQRTNN